MVYDVQEPLPPGRARRSPLTRSGRPTLTADAIAAAMLELAGQMGFRAVTMQVLAAHLGVTVRALYRHVRDRQDVVDRAVGMWLSRWPDPELDPSDWRASFTEYCHRRRAVNREHPRALLVSLDEEIEAALLPERRFTAPEAFLEFLTVVGLDLRDAQFVHADLTLRLYAFALLVDYRNDLGEQAGRYPVPAAWLERFPPAALPQLRRVRTAPLEPDELFDRIVADVIDTISRLVEGRGALSGEGERSP